MKYVVYFINRNEFWVGRLDGSELGCGWSDSVKARRFTSEERVTLVDHCMWVEEDIAASLELLGYFHEAKEE